MLDLHRLHDEFAAFRAYQSREQALRTSKLRRALAALDACGSTWKDLRTRVERVNPDWLVAGLRETPSATHAAVERPSPMTVVATDGSQIFPDRHVEPTCYVLNVSKIAFQYGTHEQPLIESVPAFHYRRSDLDGVLGDELASATTEVVSALRDEYELAALSELAVEAHIDGRPLLAMADGTLIRWMLRGMRNRALEDRLIGRYADLLAGFRERSLPLCSYISMPGNTEVVNLLRVHLGEGEEPVPEEESLSGLVDRHLFEETLPPGSRSAVFESASHIQRDYAAQDRICYFYVHACGRRGRSEVGRVEIPAWVADDAELTDLVHATVLNECEKGDGYPMILSEAHERAVIRAREKELFYAMIEEEMYDAGLSYDGSRKRASKRRPIV